jgi:hypothetical protein
MTWTGFRAPTGFWETFGEDDLSAYDMRRLVLAAVGEQARETGELA